MESAFALIDGSVEVHWSVAGSTVRQPTRSSGSPKLCDMMLPWNFSCATTASSATLKLVSKQSWDTTRNILAPGARAWDIVTSRVVSSAHPSSWHRLSIGDPGVVGGQASVVAPDHVGGQRMVTLASGMLKALSNLFRSL